MTISKKYILVISIVVVMFLLGNCPSITSEADTLEIKGSSPISLTAANILFSNRDKDRVTKGLIDGNSDLLILVEVNSRNFDFDAAAEAGYHYGRSFIRRSAGADGIALLSRIPGVGDVAEDPFFYEARGGTVPLLPMITFRVDDGEKSFGVIAVHLPPPIAMSEKERRLYSEFLSAKIEAGRMAEPFGNLKVGDPVILCGDFNALPRSRVMKRFYRVGMKDTYRRTDNFATWSFFIFGFRIDYILHGEDFTTIEYGSFDLSGSDHRGVSALIAWNGKGGEDG